MSCGCGCGGGCGGGDAGGQCRAIFTTAQQERADMQGLNDRLANYLARMREFGARANGNLDPAAYRDAIRVLEAEIAKLRAMYEDELNQLRRQLADATRDRTELTAKFTQNCNAAEGLQAQLAMERGHVQRTAEERDSTGRLLASREKELADLRGLVQNLQNELDKLRPENRRLENECAELRRRLDDELKRRLCFENKAKQLNDQSHFDSHKKDEELRDLGDRLRASQEIIVSLEKKIQQLTQGDGMDLTNLLQKLRDSNIADLKRYQRETDEALSRSLGAFRGQLNEEARAKDLLTRDKANLENQVHKLRTKVAELEGQLSSLGQQNRALENALGSEKSRAAGMISDLERRVRECQDGMAAKVQECQGARDMQVALKTEIDNYRSLLDVAAQSKLGSKTVPISRSLDDTSPCPPLPARPATACVRGSYISRGAHDMSNTGRGYPTCDQYRQNTAYGWAKPTRVSYNFEPPNGDVFPHLQGYSKTMCGSYNAYRPSTVRKSCSNFGF